MLPYACRVSREIASQLVDEVSLAERALKEHFVRTRRHARCAMVSVSARSMLTNAAAAHFVDETDHARLWQWAVQMFDTRQSGCGQLEVSGGRRVTAECEPVLCGSETVGALIRIAAPAAAPARRTKVERRRPVGWVSLSAAQLGVANLVAAGLTNQQAATRLYLSPHTIDFHLRQIFNKLGISSRVELARMVAEHRSDHENAA